MEAGTIPMRKLKLKLKEKQRSPFMWDSRNAICTIPPKNDLFMGAMFTMGVVYLLSHIITLVLQFKHFVIGLLVLPRGKNRNIWIITNKIRKMWNIEKFNIRCV